MEKSFRAQFMECSKAKLTGKGKLEKFKDFPMLLPMPFTKAGRIIGEKLKENPELGMETIACLRFGGDCRPSNPSCRNLRGLPPTETMNVSQAEYIAICNSKDKYKAAYGDAQTCPS